MGQLSLLNIVEGLYTGGLLVNPLTAKTSTLFFRKESDGKANFGAVSASFDARMHLK